MTNPENTPTFEWLNDNAEPFCPSKKVCTMECDENCPVYANTIGCRLFEDGKVEDAKEYFKRAIDNTPGYKHGAAWCNLGTAYNHLSYLKNALESFQNAYGINPGNARAVEGLAASYAALKEYDKALKWCDEYAAKFGEEGIAKLRGKIMKKMAVSN